MKIVQLNHIPILEQLWIEEALLRSDHQNWCLINTGSPPAIVMGISGKPHLVINLEKIENDQIPIIKRFSGGGTVYIDCDTVFTTFICNVEEIGVLAQPKAILEWSEKIYSPLFKNFSLQENDYIIGNRKFGGNAQYIQKGRWLHHTSFLWDYQIEKINYLLLPNKCPKYRNNRSHTDFLCNLRPYFPKKAQFIEALSEHFMKIFSPDIVSKSSILNILKRPHRQVSNRIDL
ncbi:MAG: lipoate--protein ligase family protein [Chlamydiales bacterium]